MIKTEQMSSSPPGSQAFLGCLQDATTELWNELDDINKERYVLLAKKWSDGAPPPEVQARFVVHVVILSSGCWHDSRMASSISARIIRDFQSQLFRSCGLRCIVLTAHQNENAQIITGLYVLRFYALPVHRCSAFHSNESNKSMENEPSFLSSCPDWRTVPLWKEWQKFAKKCFQGGWE